MNNIGKIAEKSNAVLVAKDKVEMLEHDLVRLESSDNYNATLEYSSNGVKRSTRRTHLTRDELFIVLSNRLRMAKEGLVIAMKEYEELT